MPSNHNSSSSGGEWEEPVEVASRSKWAELLSGALPLVDKDSLAESDLHSSNKRSEEQQQECLSRTNNLAPFRERLAPPSSNNLDHFREQPSNPPSSNLEVEGGSPVHSNNSLSSNREVVEGSTGALESVGLLALQVDSHNRVEEVPVP